MKIKTVKDVHDVYVKIMENFVGRHKPPYFNLLVDEGNGTVSHCYFQPSGPVKPGQSFMAVEDNAKVMLLLLRHPNVKHLEYDEKENMVCACFSCEDMWEFLRLDHPEMEEP